MSSHYYDAVIIGAGVAGSTLAKSLSDRGWSTVLLETKTFPRHKVCGEFLSPESIRMLHKLGLSEAIMTLEPSLIAHANLILPNGEQLAVPLPGAALGISRFMLDAALIEAAKRSGAHVMTGAKVRSINCAADSYRIEAVQNKHTIAFEAKIAISAWGAIDGAGVAFTSDEPKRHSNYIGANKTAHLSKRLKRKAKHAYVGIKAHYDGAEVQSVIELYFFPGGYLGISPIEESKINVAALISQRAFSEKPKSVAEWLEAACKSNSALQKRLAGAKLIEGSEAAIAPVDLRRKPQAWGTLPAVGDAAVMIPPLCGDGMSMALRSAELCSPLADRYLKGELTMRQWRIKYTQAVKRQFNGPRRWGKMLQWLLGNPRMTKLLLPIVRLMPFIAHRLVRETRLKP